MSKRKQYETVRKSKFIKTCIEFVRLKKKARNKTVLKLLQIFVITVLAVYKTMEICKLVYKCIYSYEWVY